MQSTASHTAGDLDRAHAGSLELVRRRPDDARAQKMRALAEWLRGNQEEALRGLHIALALSPGDADSLTHRAQMLASLGRTVECLGYFRRALAVRPMDSEMLYRMGIALGEAGQSTAAAGSYLLALICRPDHGEALNNLGVTAKNLGNVERGTTLFRRALTALPGYSPAHNNFGMAKVAQGRLDEGDDHYRRALALEPDHADAVNNHGVVASLEGDFAGAALWCRRALRLRPNYPAAYNNLGNALKDLGRLEESLDAYDEAIRLSGTSDYRHNKAIAVLATGRLREGWALYEDRWDSLQLRSGQRAFGKPRWMGEPGSGVLLLHAEQGFGDSLQFCRYAPLAAAMGWRVIVEVPRPLVRLMQTLDGVEQVVESGGPLPPFDMQCPMMSLPHAFGTEIDSIPSSPAYLAAYPADIERWEARLAGLGEGLRIGLVWAGNARRHSTDLNATDRRRSMVPELLAPLAEIPGLHLISLQKDASAPFAVTDWMDDCGDFADTAALVAGLDLVIGVDTAVIHLAAAIGKPVWMLNRFDSCWRWLREGETTAWYPAMRLFRQPTPGAWGPVVERVCEALRLPR